LLEVREAARERLLARARHTVLVAALDRDSEIVAQPRE
jgi:hypothetical protein